MICLGNLNSVPTLTDERTAAQLYVLQWFRDYYMRLNPGGLVISELDYMGRTSHSFGNPTPVQIAGNRAQTKIMEALFNDFRRKFTNGDHRKPDVMGISADGSRAELLEVTTYNNALSARTQLRDKLDTLNKTVNVNNRLHVDWRASRWKPNSNQLFRATTVSPRLIRYLCFSPSLQPPVQDGIILYEVHSIEPNASKIPVAAPKPDLAAVKDSVRGKGSLEDRVEAYLDAHPDMVKWIVGLTAVLSVAGAIATIIAVIDPVPGDELATASFASLMFRIATRARPI